MTNIKNFILKYPNFFTFIGLAVIFYLVFFHNIWAYALMDVDESRYVSMAKDMYNTKDFLTLYLNNEYFFEKPPLYFWGECLSFAIFGQINEFTARFPVALYGTVSCYILYFMGKKIVSRLYGVISALILATSLEFIILAKFAILDIVVSTCIAFSLSFGIIVYFCRESHKKYYWWLFYFFSALAVMAKGIPGFVVPFGSMFFIALASKSLKDVFRPIYFIPGMIIFLLVTLPWHIAMFKLYNPYFWNEYIIKHHLARFMGSDVIHRSQPFYFYFLTLLWGFFPWIISFLAVAIKNIKSYINNKFKFEFSLNFAEMDKSHRFMLCNIITALFTILFFSSSETKLITYILPVYLPLSALAGFIWTDFLVNKANESLINKCSYFTGGLFLLTSFAGILTPLYLPYQLNLDISTVRLFCILSSFAVGLLVILFTKKRIYKAVFASLVVFMSIFSAYATEKFFEIDYKFGQDDLIKYAKYASENDMSLTTYGFAHKYSLIYYGGKPVLYGLEMTPEQLSGELVKKKNLVIVPYKKLSEIKNKKFDIIDFGRRYILIDEDR